MNEISHKEAVAEIPIDQRFTFRITPLPGRLMNVETVGGTLVQIGKLFKSLGADIEPAVKWYTALTGTRIDDDGSICLDIVVMPVESPPASVRGRQA